MEIEEISRDLKSVSEKYGLRILFLDHTDITLISRIGFSQEIFIQVYANVKKEKMNMALVVGGERIYGIDKEGGFYHEHPVEDPTLHINRERIKIEDFVTRSLEVLKKINLI